MADGSICTFSFQPFRSFGRMATSKIFKESLLPRYTEPKERQIMIWTVTAALLGLFFLLVCFFRRSLIAVYLKLPSPSHRVTLQKKLPVEMPDGTHLFCDHYSPATREKVPTILIRTPYGRKALSFFARSFAERGYHFILQDVRGRFDSEGEYDPFVNEASDGKATLKWVDEQPWFNGTLGTWGLSYPGYVQWAMAADAPPFLKAMMPMMVGPQVYTSTYPDGAFGLCLRVSSVYATHFKARFRKASFGEKVSLLFQTVSGRESKRLRDAFDHLPIEEADILVTGKENRFYRDILTHTDARDPFWKSRDHTAVVPDVNAPVHLIGGWHDLYLREILDTYTTLKSAGKNPYLTIGPWHHAQLRPNLMGISSGLAWFDAHLKNDFTRLRNKPVRIFVMGQNQWREMETWPPLSEETEYFLRSTARLLPEPPASELSFDAYLYDPAQPTPALGGALLDRKGAGRKDNRPLEARSDVLCYSTPPLRADIEIMGSVKLTLFVASNLEHADFFARLCDVDEKNRSWNVCDGLFRMAPGKGSPQTDGILKIQMEMWATAHCFRKGRRLRLQISSGAHPRWSRNLGTGQPIGKGRQMKVAHQTVYHDQPHPSALCLPVSPASKW